MVKAVIFDVDGTLIDSVDLHARAWGDALQHFGFRIAFEDLRVLIGKGGDELLKGLLPPDVIEEKGEKIQQFRSELFQREYLPQVRAFLGVRELFERIKAAGGKVVLASSGKAEEVKRYTQIAGIADLIDDATSSDDAERSKPFPDIFRAPLARLAPIAARDAVVVGGYPL
jgi:beta-phosphoglucomutase-like phosphatase (HAD superfamily)